MLKDSGFTQTRAAAAPKNSGARHLVFNPCPLTLCSQDDQTHGEIVLDLEGGKVFSVAQHQNNPNLSFLCIESRQVELYHKGTGFSSTCKLSAHLKIIEPIMLGVSAVRAVLTSSLPVLVEIDCSGGERHVHPAAAGDAQLCAAEAPCDHHLPDRGGREQRVWQGGRDADVVHRHQSHTGPSEGRQGASRPVPSLSVTRISPPTGAGLQFSALSCFYSKEFLVALRLQGATMRHHMTQTNHSWHEQVRGFQMEADSDSQKRLLVLFL